MKDHDQRPEGTGDAGAPRSSRAQGDGEVLVTAHRPGPLAVVGKMATPTSRPAWQAQWERVPVTWHGPWQIDAAPFNEVFTQNTNYAAGRRFDFRPEGDPRLGQEVAWWLWTCWTEGLRKVEPSMLRWWCTAISAMAARRLELTGQRASSVGDFAPALVVREATRAFVQRNNRMPSAGNQRNLASIAEHIHLLVTVRCDGRHWWEHDLWDLQIDDRIPRRPHEPAAHRVVHLGLIEPDWLRQGARFYLRTTLTTDYFRWTTVATRATTFSAYLGPWAATAGHATPQVADSPEDVRDAFNDFQEWLRTPAASQRGRRLSAGQISAISSHVQSFYTFMLDHQIDAARATGNPDWRQLGEEHARLWTPTYNRRQRPTRAASTRSPGTGDTADRAAPREAAWIAAADVARMAAWTEALAAPTDKRVTITAPGDTPTRVQGLGDPQAARAWLLQALTGRRVSEILMLDYNPLTVVPGIDPATAGPDDFIARLRYQQTKVDGVDATILVDRSVSAIIAEQQAWAREHTDPGTTPTYLFLALRHNHKGQRPRPYPSHQAALRRLDRLAALVDAAGQPLAFTQTHRLRHTRATELLNAGVPIHVVQRYLGHRSPEMTMRYAATLDHVAEAEFLKAKKAGAFGTDLALTATDAYDITQLSRRTDRILPNGACLLPPAKTCDRGNACLTCGHFATDATHRPELQAQHRRTLDLIDQRQNDFTQRHGCPMPDTNIWLQARYRELASLDAILDALATSDATHGAGTQARHPHPPAPPQRTTAPAPPAGRS